MGGGDKRISLWTPWQPGLHGETLAQKTKPNKLFLEQKLHLYWIVQFFLVIMGITWITQPSAARYSKSNIEINLNIRGGHAYITSRHFIQETQIFTNLGIWKSYNQFPMDTKSFTFIYIYIYIYVDRFSLDLLYGQRRP